MTSPPPRSSFFFFNDTATTEIYTLSLHDRSSDLPVDSSALQAAHRPDRQKYEDPEGHRAKPARSEEHTSELQSPCNLVCRLLLEKKKKNMTISAVCLTTNTMH